MEWQRRAQQIEKDWQQARWQQTKRTYSAATVAKLQGTLQIDHSLATNGANKLWQLLQQQSHITAMGSVTANQAMQQVKAGIQVLYASGWQVAADNNTANSMYPDLGLYPSNSMPALVKTINSSLKLQDQQQTLTGSDNLDWFKPIIVDGEAGFGGILNVYELTSNLIAAGVAAVHFEDQLPQARRCGHLGGKVIISAREMQQKLIAARLAADVAGVPLVLIGRTDAYGAKFINTDIDTVDKPFTTGKRTDDGLYYIDGSIEHAIARMKAFAPYVDMLWCETGKPDLNLAEIVASEIKKDFPDKLMVYNCSPSFNWQQLPAAEINSFQKQLASLGFKLQIISLAGFHALNLSMFKLAHDVINNSLPGYVTLQQQEFAASTHGYTAVKHQQEVGALYFDAIINAITKDKGVMAGSTEDEQF